jgi:hypothetical protein
MFIRIRHLSLLKNTTFNKLKHHFYKIVVFRQQKGLNMLQTVLEIIGTTLVVLAFYAPAWAIMLVKKYTQGGGKK